MIIEGNLLIGILIVVALAIGALVVYIRIAVKKEPSDADSVFSRLLRFGEKDEEDDSQDAENAETATVGAGGPGGLSLPVPNMSVGKIAREDGQAKNGPFSVNLGGMFSGMLGSKKSKEKIKEEVRAIDEQLNSVLQETEEINVPGLPPQISAEDSPSSTGRGMRELDLEMGTVQGTLDIISPADINLEPSLDLASPVPKAPKKPGAEPVNVEQKKPDAPQTPVEAGAKPPTDFVMDDKRGTGDDLLSDLESSAKQEVVIDMSIMKEYQDMPLTCVEIESDLKGILDQITINSQNRGR